MLSANEAIGVPSRPVMKMRYRSALVVPHLKRVPVVKSYGWIGWSLLSVSDEADGPSPRPSTPWHFQHSNFCNIARPARMLSVVTGVSGGISTGVPAFSVFQRAENVLM